jgi:SOS-response transcriptional repressor LexA
MSNLTPTQRAVLKYCMTQSRAKGNLPTCKAIAEHFNWSSANSAYQNIKALRKKGYLAPKNEKKGRIELPQGDRT